MRIRTPLLFLCAGGIAALINLGTRALYNLVLPYEISVLLAFFSSMGAAFILFKYTVFRAGGTGRLPHEVGVFVLVNLLALLQTFCISVGCNNYLFPWLGMNWHPATVAHALGVGFPVFTSYIGHKHLTFGKKL
jgi:Predicted membrane protein